LLALEILESIEQESSIVVSDPYGARNFLESSLARRA
jgi:hypothetical protein